MPAKSKKSSPKKRPEVKTEGKVKPRAKPHLRSVKLVSKPKIEAKAPSFKASKVTPKSSSIFWKILAERERRKEKFPPKTQNVNHRGTQYPKAGKHEQYARFAGPRRRVA